jgi:hypothetical protein
MSTSHYASTSYNSITSPSRTDDYPEPHMSEMRSVLPAWESPLSKADRPSLSRSRPECNDVGMDTIRIPLAAARNYHKAALRARYVALFALAAVMLMADGIALAVWTENVVEHYVFAALAISAELLLIACAIGCRKL